MESQPRIFSASVWKPLVLLYLVFSLNAFAQPSDAYILGVMGAQKMPGTAAVVIRDSNWVWSRTWGRADIPKNIPVRPETIFLMASVSKTMTVTALMQLWEQGSFKLDDNINAYLPFQIHNPHFPADTITFRMLMTHTSSIRDNGKFTDAMVVPGDSPIPLDAYMRGYFVPGNAYYDSVKNFYDVHSGSKSIYSNVGITLAAYLVQCLTGVPFDEYCAAHVFVPLCMANTSFKLAGIEDTSLIARPYSWNGTGYDDAGLYGFPDYPDGQLRTTLASLARFMAMYMNHGVFQGTRILKSATIDTILKVQFPNVTSAGDQGLVFARFWANNGDLMWGHMGGYTGVSTDMYFNRKKSTGVIVFGNGDGFDKSVDSVWDTVYSYGATLTPKPSDVFPACPMPTSLAALEKAKAFSVATVSTTGGPNIRILASGPITELSIVNTLNRVVYGAHPNQRNVSLRLAGRGIFFLTMKSAQATIVRKLIVD